MLAIHFFDVYFLGFQEIDVRNLSFSQEEHALSISASSGCPSDPVHEGVAVLWWVILDNPIDVWDVDTSSGEISCQQHQMVFCLPVIKLALPKLLIDFTPFFLVDLAMEFKNLHIRFFEQFLDLQNWEMEINTCASSHENYNSARLNIVVQKVD
jgi:hypothetical protein